MKVLLVIIGVLPSFFNAVAYYLIFPAVIIIGVIIFFTFKNFNIFKLITGVAGAVFSYLSYSIYINGSSGWEAIYETSKYMGISMFLLAIFVILVIISEVNANKKKEDERRKNEKDIIERNNTQK